MSEDKPKVYPIAEIFNSPQGEGLYTGVMMTFVRFAGCSVGRPIKDPMRIDRVNLPVWQEKCTLYDGREFLCDTDFRTKETLTVDDIVARIPTNIKHVCFTGGEPLIHDLLPLVKILPRDKKVHVETSGTILRNGWPTRTFVKRPMFVKPWLTVSPKKDVLPAMLDYANEVKLLVDEDFVVDKIPVILVEHPLVYIQPVNYDKDINYENLARCLELLERFPTWRLSTQMHKIWNVR